jgi:hypothetical protein
VVGQALPGQKADKLSAQSIAVVVRTSPDMPSFVRIDGKPVGEFAAGTKGEPPHTVKIRWKQAGGVISDIVAELDDQKIEADGGFTFAAPKCSSGATDVTIHRIMKPGNSTASTCCDSNTARRNRAVLERS